MIQFADEAVITVSSGKGGNGCISFRREKYIPLGGPSGGDGGKGGDVYFVVKRNMRTLSRLRRRPILKAKNGSDGMSWGKYGKNGDDLVIPVPPGTSLRDYESGELIHDFTTQGEDEMFLLFKGGKGGWGNIHFKSSTNQAPRIANKGELGVTKKIRVELSVMADVGLVGFPNAGKSSLLTAFTNARPKVAPYPFTTKIPNLGVLRVDDERDIIIADIPGIIEGASEGVGLGFKFLKHVSRTQCLLFIIDASDQNYLTAYDTLSQEIASYSQELAKKPRMVLCNKIDIEGADERAKEIKESIQKKDKNISVLSVSILNNIGMKALRNAIIELADKIEAQESLKEKGVQQTASSFMAERESIDDDAEVQYPGSEN
ncbi:MAG: GTPase ObgE [Treponema sp.]|nr:GTPase ObgE [Treponema sp.]